MGKPILCSVCIHQIQGPFPALRSHQWMGLLESPEVLSRMEFPAWKWSGTVGITEQPKGVKLPPGTGRCRAKRAWWGVNHRINLVSLTQGLRGTETGMTNLKWSCQNFFAAYAHLQGWNLPWCRWWGRRETDQALVLNQNSRKPVVVWRINLAW